MNRKIKTGLLRLKLSCGALRFNPARLWGVENAVKGRDERRKKRAALDSIFNAMPPSVFFYLDTAVVVIDRMTEERNVSMKQQRSKCKKSQPLRMTGLKL